ncbi:TetR/AcrR family transcriptional regulator (plasmid) [Embleya sp. NBC_00888]|uniref:TetR/AcrR family transcriptional regulator n=1 Tax=Embleya sp. NBC_00888 TaxID=2975960 RepID=UPI002F90F651|nr:TetR/AcrR family transcriptional regulator [Embleya sp. NBC_00888]
MPESAHVAHGFGVPGRAPHPRAVRSRAAVLKAARELLLEDGWAAVTHVGVAARSGVGRTTVYRHWPEPTALIRDAIVQLVAEYRDRLGPAVGSRPGTRTGGLREELVAALDGTRLLLHDREGERAMRVLIERASDPAFVGVREILQRAGTHPFRVILDAAKARGDLPVDLDADAAIDRLVGPLVFRRLLANGTIGKAYVRQVVDDFLTAHAERGRPRER